MSERRMIPCPRCHLSDNVVSPGRVNESGEPIYSCKCNNKSVFTKDTKVENGKSNERPNTGATKKPRKNR